jgi:hypothetical protein
MLEHYLIPNIYLWPQVDDYPNKISLFNWKSSFASGQIIFNFPPSRKQDTPTLNPSISPEYSNLLLNTFHFLLLGDNSFARRIAFSEGTFIICLVSIVLNIRPHDGSIG